MSEKVNHPTYYNASGRKECIEEIREKYGNYITYIFCLTNAYKYLYRAGMKEDNSAKQDIAKARWYYDYTARLIVDDTTNSNRLFSYITKELVKYENNKTQL